MDSSSPKTAGPFLYVLLGGLLVFLALRWWPHVAPGPGLGDKTATPREVTPRNGLYSDEKANIQIFKDNSPSTVHVRTFSNVRRDQFSLNVLKVPKGSGSGFVWDDKGRVITNYHVISGARTSNGSIAAGSIQVTLGDHSTWNVYDVSFDEDRDLAVLWIDAPRDRLKPVSIGESHNLQVGQIVYAIGNPFGLDQSLTTGIISALGREIPVEGTDRTIRGVIQTDAAINPGNSGGPLLDSAGRLIGVNTAIVSPSGGSSGIGFAIPIDEVNGVVTRLIRKEQNLRPALGIVLAPDQFLQKQGLEGVLILDVVPDGPAEKSKLRPTRRGERNIILGDIIVGIDGKKIASNNDLMRLLENEFQVGQTVSVTVLRDGREIPVSVTLTAKAR